MSVTVNFKGTHAGIARGMDAAPVSRSITARIGGKLRSFTPADLIKGVAMGMRPVLQARQQKAFDEGLRLAKSRIANNAIAAALLQSNQTSYRSQVRAIDCMFDEPHQGPALSLDQAIDGIAPEAPQQLEKLIQEL